MSTPLLSAVTAGGAALGNQEATVLARDVVLRGERLELPAARSMTQAELADLTSGLQAMRQELVKKHLTKARSQSAKAGAILAIIQSASTSLGRSGFHDPDVLSAMREKVAQAIANGSLLPIVLPIGGGKVANPVKTGSIYLPDLSEWMAHVHLAAMAEAINEVYPPGARVLTIPDAPLHTGDVGFPWVEVNAHVGTLRADLIDLKISEYSQVAETVALLPDSWPDFVRRSAQKISETVLDDPRYASAQAERVRSLQYSMNLAVNGWSYEHSILVVNAIAGHAEGLPTDVLGDALDVRRSSERIVSTYDAVNLGIRQLGVAERAAEALTGRPDHFRLTVHAKPGEPRPQLSQNGPRSRPALIPMHGLALRYRHKDSWRVASIFDVEARIHGFRPVRHPVTGRFLFFEADVDQNILVGAA